MAAGGQYVTRTTVKQRMGKLLKPYWKSAGAYAGFSDEAYYLPTAAELELFVREHPVGPVPAADLFDCDDFAFVMKGSVCLYARVDGVGLGLTAPLCFGIAWGFFAWRGVGKEPHACNWCLLDSRSLAWVEPQDGTLHAVEECRRGLEMIIV